MLNKHLLGTLVLCNLSKYSQSFGHVFLKASKPLSSFIISNNVSTMFSLKRNTSSNLLFSQPKTCIQKLKLIRDQSTLLQLNNEKLDKYLKTLNEDILESQFNLSQNHPVFYLLKDKALQEDNLQQAKELKESLEHLRLLKESEEKNTKDEQDMLVLVEEDIKRYTTEVEELNEKILTNLLPKESLEDCNDIVLEISSGVGGLEAMLFASDLRDMYCNFLKYKGWQFEYAENDESELGGVRHCSLLVSGAGVFRMLRHEAGVHRVQRVPATERSGRVHTSTVSVAVLPQPSDVEVNLKESDLKIETKRASGAGGQHVNTTDSAVRIHHIPTGIIVECQSGRNQLKNKTTAMQRLKAKIYERETNEINTNIKTQRKTQIGTSGRSEKIRTYNYRDDRVSDHRLTINVHNLREFLQGGESLEKLLSLLERWHHNHRVQRFIDSLL